MKIIAGIVSFLILSISVFIISYSLVAFILKHAPQENAQRATAAVRVVCAKAYNTTNGILEEACSKAQDVTHTEYICPYISQTADQCWVEQK